MARGGSTRFKPGQSGNPSGRPKQLEEVRDLARNYTVEAVATLAGIMQDTEASRNERSYAANSLLDRAWGKPSQDVNLGGQKDNPISVLVNLFEKKPA